MPGVGNKGYNPEPLGNLHREQIPKVKASVLLPGQGNVIFSDGGRAMNAAQNPGELPVRFTLVHDEVRTDRTLKGVVQSGRLGGAKRPIPNFRQATQDPLGSHVLVEDFHQTGHLLEYRGGYLTRGTGKNSVAQAGPQSAPSPTGSC